MKGKRIYITAKEADAIRIAFEQVNGCAEAAGDEYNKSIPWKQMGSLSDKLRGLYEEKKIKVTAHH